MKVYFLASSSESTKSDFENYVSILNTVKTLKHTITNPYFKSFLPNVTSNDPPISPSDDVYEILRKKIITSDCVVAEISVPSVSSGIQIEFALSNKIPVLCLFSEGNDGRLPLMLRDYRNSLLVKETYNKDNIREVLNDFFTNVPKARIKFNMFITYDIEQYLNFLSAQDKKPKSEVIRDLIMEKMNADNSYKSKE